ncbi:kinase-like protein [Paxillus ammoniavirescens]|nr:kinase-like protein [Paxillus ammoniavirescens]
MPNGTLQRFLDKRDGKLAIAQGLELLLGIASGLIYLHSYPIIHGDLNSNNVLIDKTFSARLAGFCHASVVGQRERILAYPQESKQCQVAVRWAAPELVPQELEKTCEPTPLSDIYSFGNIALQVLSGKQPWSETKIDDDVLSQLAKGVNPGRPQSRPIDDGHWEFIQQCWLPVQERPPAIDLVPKLQHFLDMIYVVVVFGRMGMGISSLVNLIIGKTEAEVSNDSQQCTQEVGRYDADIDDTKLEVCDIPGFDVSKKSMDNAVASIVQIHKKRGIDLLINCLQPTHGIVPRYYQAVTSAVGSEVPIAAVVTHLEREDGAMENWWSRNGGTLESQKKLKFVDHACVTTAGLCATNHDHDTNTLRRRESERAVRALISRHCKGPKRPPGS